MRRATLIVLLVWLAACAGLWWGMLTLAERASLNYAAAVFADRIESHLAFQEYVRWDVFWTVWRYLSIMPSLVASIVALASRDRSKACSRAVVAFLACTATVMLLMGAWSAWVADQFLIDTFQIIR